MKSYPFINAKPIAEYSAETYAQHLKSIVSHTAKVSRERKLAAKAKREAYAKPKARPWNFRFSPKGNPMITLRGRPDSYLYRIELEEMLAENPSYADAILLIVAQRPIEIRAKMEAL